MLEKQGQLLEDIRNYHWMLRECERIGEDIRKEESNSSGLMNFRKQQGFDSSNRASSRLNETRKRHRNKIKRVNDVLVLIENDRDYAIVTCLVDGMNVREVSKHIGISRGTVYGVLEDLEKKERKSINERRKRPILREIRAHGL